MGYVGAYDQGSAASEPKLQDLFFTSLSPACDGLYVSRDATGCSFLVSAEINWGNREPVDVSADINGSVSFTGAGGSWQGTVPASQLFAGAGEPGDGAIRVILTGHYRNLDVNGNPVGQPCPSILERAPTVKSNRSWLATTSMRNRQGLHALAGFRA